METDKKPKCDWGSKKKGTLTNHPADTKNRKRPVISPNPKSDIKLYLEREKKMGTLVRRTGPLKRFLGRSAPAKGMETGATQTWEANR